MLLHSSGMGNPILTPHRSPPSRDATPPPGTPGQHRPAEPAKRALCQQLRAPASAPPSTRREVGGPAGEIEPGAGPPDAQRERRGRRVPDLGFPRSPRGSARTSRSPLPAADLVARAQVPGPNARPCYVRSAAGCVSLPCPAPFPSLGPTRPWAPTAFSSWQKALANPGPRASVSPSVASTLGKGFLSPSPPPTPTPAVFRGRGQGKVTPQRTEPLNGGGGVGTQAPEGIQDCLTG